EAAGERLDFHARRRVRMPWFFERKPELSRVQMIDLVRKSAQECLERICRRPKRVLLLPPDITRAHSGAGWMTEELYNFFSEMAEVYAMPTLGQHVPHTPEQNRSMFGRIPEERILVHDWIADGKRLG